MYVHEHIKHVCINLYTHVYAYIHIHVYDS